MLCLRVSKRLESPSWVERINMQYNRGALAEPVIGAGRLPCLCRSGALPAASAATTATAAGVTTAET